MKKTNDLGSYCILDCSDQPSGSPAPRSATSCSCRRAEPYEIAVVVKITGIPWFNVVETGVDRAAKELSVNAYQTGPAQADPAAQVKIVEDLVAKGVDAIAVVPNDAKALEPVFQKAKEKGIVVITHESPDQVGTDFDFELIDNVKFGQHAWDQLVKYMGDSW